MFDQALLAALNHLLGDAAWARARLSAHAGRHVRCELPPFHFTLAIGPDGHFTSASHDVPPDVTVQLPAASPFLLLQGMDTLMAGIHVEGNAEFATELSFVLRHLHWDVEEDLSRLLGDIPAHRIVQVTRRVHAWHAQARTRLVENVAEYLQHDSPLLVNRHEFAGFRKALTNLDASLDDLEKRLLSCHL